MRFTKDKGNLTIPLQKIKLQMKRAWKESNQITKQKTINKMSIVSPYLSIVILNVNEANYSIKRYRGLNGLKNGLNYMLPTRNSIQL